MSLEPTSRATEIEDRLQAMAHRLSGTADPDTGLLSMLLEDIRERRRVEAELAESRQWLELAHEAAGVCAYSFDPASGTLEWSASTRALYGFEPGDAPTIETWLATIHPEDRTRVASVAERAIAQGASIDQGFRVVLPDSRVRHVRDRGRVLKDEAGRPAKVVGLNIDVTELVEAREAAEDAQRLAVLSSVFPGQDVRSGGIQAFLDALPTGLMLTNTAREATYVNKTLNDMWRGRQELPDAAAWNKYVAWSASTGERIADADWPLARAVLSGQPQPVEELRFQRFDGSMGYMLVSAVPLLDANGATVSAVAIAQDVSDWRAAERQAQLETALLRKLGDVTPDYLFVKDREGRLLYANSAVVSSIARPWSEIVGRTEFEWHHDPDEAAAIHANDERIMASGASETLEEVYTTEAGTAVVRATKTPITDDFGQVIGLVGVGVDVTRERKAQEHLELLVNELNHRVKNTLTIVQSMARNAFRGIDVAEDAYRSFEDRLVALASAHDLLSEGYWAEAQLEDVIRRTCGPHVADRFEISGDNVQVSSRIALAISMAVHELCTNATKYGALKGGGRVRIGWTVDDDQLSLSWQERGGPAVRPPEKMGFGSRMLQQAIGALPGGRIETTYETAGLQCSLHCSLG
ncbi:PAS domain-containing protein [uncultured Caulobacter sp.]|uniref:PAS domain-containing protein n=1 Tax=uncultured Caulobacter sp. TaxID=158749 RepID=UPI00260676C7|nr:PAS domain-containing protein [uncultured Caulobacter sp.]